jgi:hypothetical protein
MPDNLPGLDTLVITKVYLAPTIVYQIILNSRVELWEESNENKNDDRNLSPGVGAGILARSCPGKPKTGCSAWA